MPGVFPTAAALLALQRLIGLADVGNPTIPTVIAVFKLQLRA